MSNFDTSKVLDMGYMFDECSSMTSLELGNFNTANVTNMYKMFSNCKSLTYLDLSSFNTSNVTDMSIMFMACSSLKTIYAGNWNISERSSEMFINCKNLVGGQGTKTGNNLYGYDEKGNPLYYYCGYDGNYAHIDGGKDNPGLFTAK